MYVVLPFGIGSTPRKLTKVLKPILSFLLRQGIIVLTYIDDGFTVALTYQQCYENICDIMCTFSAFGFIIHKTKSAPVPSHQVCSLGFHLNSITMNITVPADKIANVVNLASAVLVASDLTVFHIAQLIGTFVSLFPACPLGRAHYRGLESLKVKTLKTNRGSYSAACFLDSPAVEDIHWWLQNVPHTAAPISRPLPSDTLFTDSTDKAWGTRFNGQYAQSHFSIYEQDHIIALKELLAVLYGLCSFVHMFSGSHISIHCDNVGALAYVCDMGGMRNSTMNEIAKEIWQFTSSHGLWFSISYIKSSDNVLADLTSRILNDRTQWALSMSIFTSLTRMFFMPDIDLFASHLNTKLERYVSWILDPYCFEVDSFSISWTHFAPFLFPPFSILFRCLQKMQTDQVPRALIVFLLWTTQHWFPILLHLLTSEI